MKKQSITFIVTLAVSIFTAQAQVTQNEKDFRKWEEVIASDSFGGRAPLTPYETKTINYIASQFKEIGLIPANGDSYFQKVPLLKVATQPAGGSIKVKTKNGKVSLKNWDDIIITSVRGKKTVNIPKADFVFAGFGINAPEYGWNDYKDLDVKGKIVLVLVNDPGYYNPSLFKGKDMTYYGRWIYKFEEASRQGAAGVLVIHDTQPASYGWNVVQASWGSKNLSLVSDKENADKVALQGWISLPATQRLFKSAGVDFEKAFAAAKQSGFKAIDLKAESNVKLKNDVYISNSHNVAAILPGSDKKDEYLVYSAHWDHFGIQKPVNGDSIYNGASDNASGVAALLVLARKFSHQKQQPKRSILFLSVTAEEAVLLGSEYYTQHPLVPIKIRWQISILMAVPLKARSTTSSSVAMEIPIQTNWWRKLQRHKEEQWNRLEIKAAVDISEAITSALPRLEFLSSLQKEAEITSTQKMPTATKVLVPTICRKMNTLHHGMYLELWMTSTYGMVSA